MKLFLSSAGLLNESLKKAFLDLVGKPVNEIKVVFIPTAANIEAGDKWWLVKDLNILQNMGFAQFDIVDISAVPKSIWQPRLEEADALFFGGGNTFYLKYWIEKSGLKELLTELLKTRVWAGISAGSILPGTGIIDDEERQASEDVLGEDVGTEAFGYVGFSVMPHFLSPLFEDNNEDGAARIAGQFGEPMYALDDQSAIVIGGDKLEVVSEGKWRKFEK